MRKMPVLTMVCLVALGLVAAPTFAATVAANDTPDIVLQEGQSVSFDLADFFSSAEGALTYTAEGATVAGSVVTVDGSAPTATFSAGGVSLESEVVVSSFVIGNAPEVDNNNRIVGKDGGNVFYNALVPNGVINSKVNLSGLPTAGGAGTGTGETAVAALIAKVASVDLSVANTGLVQAVRMDSDASGLTPVLNQDGSYKVTAGANFAGTWLVTLGATDGASKDAVHLLAASAVAVDLSAFTAIPAGTAPQAALANGVVTAAAGEGVLAFGSAIEVGAGNVVSLVADYTATADANVALVLFDGGLGNILAFTNPSGANIEVGAAKNLSMSMVSMTGTVIPAFQVVAGAAASTVTLANMAVVKAGPVTDYALDANATAYKSSLASVAGWNALDGVGPVADADNNFASADGAGCMKLVGTGGVSNALMTVALEPGTAVAECYAKAVSGTGTFAIALTDGGALSSVSFATLGTSWSKVVAVATPGAAGSVYLVVQSAGNDALVDDICVRVVKDKAAFADLSLLGL
jgi:hypothetical protein